MPASKHNRTTRQARSARVRMRMRGTTDRPRLSVFRSGNHISLQLIDDTIGKTLVSVSDIEVTKEAKAKKTKKRRTSGERASWVGETMGKRAHAAGITQVRFDRGRYRYHGLIKLVAESARKAGLKF